MVDQLRPTRARTATETAPVGAIRSRLRLSGWSRWWTTVTNRFSKNAPNTRADPSATHLRPPMKAETVAVN